MSKIYFAGTEHINHALMAKLGGAKHCLMTAFPFVKRGAITRAFIADYLASFCKGVILDSGLFTLMFGAEKGNKSEHFIYEWQDKLIEFIKNNDERLIPVEVDCQKVLSPQHAWSLRKRMRESLRGRTFINVYHFEDKKKGLDEMIEFSDYIAISVPEIRGKKGVDTDDVVYKLACYIKNQKPRIGIHLLGCTQLSILEKCRFVSSSDSTSWMQFARWGAHSVVQSGRIVKARVMYDHDETERLVLQELKTLGKAEPTQKMKSLLCDGVVQVREHIKIYSKHAGAQN